MTPILIVDDSEDDLRAASALLSPLVANDVTTASTADEALLQLERRPSMLVVTDIHMPIMDGLELLRVVRTRFPLSPVVVMTAHGSENLAATALNDGASGYVPKRLLDRQLVPTVQKVMNSMAARHERQRLEQILDVTETRFVLKNELELLKPVIGYIQEKINRLLRFDDNELLRIGLAIEEAMTNAICHGNLEVDSRLKEAQDGSFHELVNQRQRQLPFSERRLYVTGRVSSDEFVCVVRDEGAGFDVESVPDPLAEENLDRTSGRGLLLIRQFMDGVRHNDDGNEITMVKQPGPALRER